MRKLILPENIISFMDHFVKNGFEIYLVGGAVRDLFLDLTIHNWDFTTNAKPEEIMKLYPKYFYNNTYGTVSIPQEDSIFEVTPYRKEGTYNDSRHPSTVEWSDTIESDLSRRDFTINAMAYDGKTIVDLFEGQKDIEEKNIRTVGDPQKRFEEDALRLMRAVRLANQLQFNIEHTTLEAIQKHSKLLKNVSGERIRDEFFKILSSTTPSQGVMLLKDTGLLKIIIPELDEAFEVPQKSPKRHHIYDVGTHSVMSLKECKSEDVIVRLATLLHDIGKPKSFHKDEETQLITFYNHEIYSAEIANRIADELRLSKEQKTKLYKLVRYHQFTVSETQTDKAVKRFIREVGLENVDDMLILREADRVGSGATPTSWRLDLFKKRIIEVQNEPFKVTDLKIDGNDVMKTLSLKPGKKIGEILQNLFEKVEDKTIPNEKDALLKELLTYN